MTSNTPTRFIYSNTNTKSFKSPFNTFKGNNWIFTAKFSLDDYQTIRYCINELAEFMDAYTLNYLTQGTSETLK